MKPTSFFLIFLLFALGCGEKEPCCECSPPPQWAEVALPDSVSLGGTLVFLNGEEADFHPIFVYRKFYKIMGYSFLRIDGDIWSEFGFGALPLKDGYFGLHTKNQRFLPDKALTGFGQIVDEDLEGYSYKLEDSVEGFFHVEHLDSINQVVRGRFKVAFCRTSKNGYDDLGLPEHLLFQGVFHEKYEVQ